MNRFAVELVGTSPILTNNCVVDKEHVNAFPKTDVEAARFKLYRNVAHGGYAMSSDSVLALVGWLTDTKAKPPWAAVEGGVSLDGEWAVYVVEHQFSCWLARWCYPKFDAWRARFTLALDPRWYEAEKIRELFAAAGPTVGLPQFTPNVKDGEWGRFTVSGWNQIN